MSKKIQKSNLSYILPKFIVNFGIRSYFGHIAIRGKKNLPKGESYILAPNHQNAFLDALAILYLNKCRPTVFLARADIFSNTTAAKILRYLKIMPIYRSRDGGKKVLEQNDQIIEDAISVVTDKVPFCMMAEGTHNSRRRLLPLKKGLFRIALESQKRIGEERPVYIVPVGIDYEDFTRSGRGVVINIGKPISMLEFLPKYRKAQAVAINKVLERTRTSLMDKMHHIESKDFYEQFYHFSTLYAEVKCKNHLLPSNATLERFDLRRKATKALELREKERFDTLISIPKELRGFQKRKKITRSHNFRRSIMLLLILVATITLSCIFNWQVLLATLLACPIPFLPTHLLFRKNDDPQFIGSLNFATQFLLCLFYVLIMTVLVFVLQGWKFGLLMLALGLLAWRCGSSLAMPR